MNNEFVGHLDATIERWKIATSEYLEDATSLAAFDEQLDQAQRLVTAIRRTNDRLKTLRNRRCKINTLPVEILRTIFEYASFYGFHAKINLAITHTCLYWRIVALSDFALWTCLAHDTVTKEYAEAAVLTRSGDMPLFIISDEKMSSLPLTRLTPPWLMEFWATHITRIKILSIKPDPSCYSPPNCVILTRTASLLEELNIQLAAPSGRMYRDPWTPKLLEDNAPQLRSLNLIGSISMPWSRGMYKNLTTLKLIFIAAETTIRGDIEAICQDSPRLQSLIIVIPRSKPVYDFTMPPLWCKSDRRRTTMAHLRGLGLHLPIELCSRLLSRILPIPQPTFRCNIQTQSRHGDRLKTLFSPECFPAVDFVNIDRLVVIGAGNTQQRAVELAGATRTHVWTFVLHGAVDSMQLSDFRDIVSEIQANYPQLPRLQEFSIAEKRGDSPSVTNFIHGTASLLWCYARTITKVSFLQTMPSQASSTQPEPSSASRSTLLQSIHLSLLALQLQHGTPRAGLFPCLQNVKITVSGDGLEDCPDPSKIQHPCDDFRYIICLIQFMALDPRKIALTVAGAGRITVDSMKQAAECVQELRKLGGTVYWTHLRFSIRSHPASDSADRTFYPREVWPANEEYTWRCQVKEDRGKHFELGGCCGYLQW